VCAKSQTKASGQKATFIKSPCDIADKMRGLMECWSNRLTLDNLRLSERYLKFGLHILIRFRYRDSVEYIALLQRKRCAGFGFKNGSFLVGSEPVSNANRCFVSGNAVTVHGHKRIAQGRGEQGTVLVEEVQAVDVSENCAFPSIVCFDSFERFNSLWPKSLYYSTFFGFVFCGRFQALDKFITVIPSREVQTRNQGRFLAIDFSHSINEVVERRTQTVDSIANDSWKHIGDGPCLLKSVDAFSGVKVIIGTNFVGLDPEFVPLNTQICDVMFGPFDFGSQAVKIHESTLTW